MRLILDECLSSVPRSMLQYGPHPRQHLWASGTPGGRWLVVIHGGLWRDERVTAQSGVKLARAAAHRFDGVASIDYRLSPEISHPVHMNDCKQAVEHLVTQYSPRSLVFVGHSAGCYLAGQIAPYFTTERVVGLEGIYDVPDLVSEYPSLEQPIAEAFPAEHDRPDWARLPLLVVHSKQDELVSMRQPQLARRLNPDAQFVRLTHGRHDEVFEQAMLEDALELL